MKKITIIAALGAVLVLSGCAAGATGPADLTGDWKQSNSASTDAYQQAKISDDEITIEWVSDGGDTVSTYWVGTFEAPVDGGEPYTWTSERNEEATDSALLASTADSKEFTYEGGVVSYEVSALGTTTIVDLKKN
ncbi:lipoprotein [Salinibacterium sp. NSLL150]|uniref:lipoprotein n=1 Tax=unclassified Salinibacterium TaxID=2632331 RepID=UPI0018CEB117|nr:MULTISPECIES: lipoprotein [unclassified Salinibacterium]MBH0098589.1 lipoprotein [Salinibacterium sp. NSLL35]MBH0101344.1 lipoprotein [Salinibacterium sp. NSLL150]MBH0104103.1 lipoprotein [Salinibacterium sp. NSLL16]MBH0106864.1 lipoprotein [Salinibacterium sp. NSLL17]